MSKCEGFSRHLITHTHTHTLHRCRVWSSQEPESKNRCHSRRRLTPAMWEARKSIAFHLTSHPFLSPSITTWLELNAFPFAWTTKPCQGAAMPKEGWLAASQLLSATSCSNNVEQTNACLSRILKVLRCVLKSNKMLHRLCFPCLVWVFFLA